MIQRAPHTVAAPVQDMGIDHGCSNVLMPEQFLNCTNVIAALQQMRGEAVAQSVRRDALLDTGVQRRLPYGTLDLLFLM
jgi:hypothetical protein